MSLPSPPARTGGTIDSCVVWEVGDETMELTADDLWPLVAKLPREEQVRLARRALAREACAAEEAETYRQLPVSQEEFGDETDDPLAWDAEGWEGVK